MLLLGVNFILEPIASAKIMLTLCAHLFPFEAVLRVYGSSDVDQNAAIFVF